MLESNHAHSSLAVNVAVTFQFVHVLGLYVTVPHAGDFLSILITAVVFALSAFPNPSVLLYLTYFSHTLPSAHSTLTLVHTVFGVHALLPLLYIQYFVVFVLLHPLLHALNVIVTLFPVHPLGTQLAVVVGNMIIQRQLQQQVEYQADGQEIT